MGKVLWNPGTLLGPVPPALVTCGSVEQPNVLTVAWTGIVNTKPPMTYVSIRPQRYSYGLIKESGEFVINLTTAALVRAADFCGVKSGRDMDKLAVCGREGVGTGFGGKPPELGMPGQRNHRAWHPSHVPSGDLGHGRGGKPD